MPVAFYAAWLPRSFTLNALQCECGVCSLISAVWAIHLSSSQLLRFVFLRFRERGGRLEVAGPIHLWNTSCVPSTHMAMMRGILMGEDVE